MCDIRLILIGSMIALLGAATAQANVIYNWQSTEPGQFVTATSGRLVFTDAAYRSGSIDFHVNDPASGTSAGVNYDYEVGRITNSPVVSAQLLFDATTNPEPPAPFPGFSGGISVHPGSEEFFFESLPFSSEIVFNDDGTLTGSLFLTAEEEQARASGTRRYWSVFDYGTEFFQSGPCGPIPCSGGSGFWQLDSTSVEVPAPSVWPLFGLSVLALFSLTGLRRKA